MADLPVEHLKRLEEIANKGSILYAFYQNSWFILNENILAPMKAKVIEEFARKVDPANVTQVIYMQTTYNMLNDIEKAILQKIEEGRLALEQIKQLNTPPFKEDE